MPNTFIIIKGQPKALQIEQFRMGDNGVYDVKFKSSPRTYHYRYSDVVWLKDAPCMVYHYFVCQQLAVGRKEVFFEFEAESYISSMDKPTFMTSLPRNIRRFISVTFSSSRAGEYF